MANGLFEQLNGKFINVYEKKALFDLGKDLEMALMFGEKTALIMKLRETAYRNMTDLSALGKLTMIDIARVSKLLDSNELENVNLATHLLNSKA